MAASLSLEVRLPTCSQSYEITAAAWTSRQPGTFLLVKLVKLIFQACTRAAHCRVRENTTPLFSGNRVQKIPPTVAVRSGPVKFKQAANSPGSQQGDTG